MEKIEKSEKSKKPTIKNPIYVQGGIFRPKIINLTALPLIKAKKSLPIITINTQKCGFCESSVQKILFKSHVESHPTKILDYLYLGSYANAINKKELKIINVGYILNCAVECKNAFINDYSYLKVPIVDFPNIDISKYFSEAFEFIEKAKNNQSIVFVHCQMGKSRSVSIVIAYLMKYFKHSFASAFDFVRSRRKIAFPNIGFIKKLKEYEQFLSRG